MSGGGGRAGSPSWTAGEIFELVRSGAASSRADLARLTGLAGSTVLLRVEALLAQGYLVEGIARGSGRGRRPRMLSVRADAGFVAMADLGPHHVVLGIMGLDGTLLTERALPLRIGDGPGEVLPWLVGAVRELAGTLPSSTGNLLGLGVGLPGPVSTATGRMMTPSLMPGWNGCNVRAALEELSGVPVIVENDANMMAAGEHGLIGHGVKHMMFVKVGSGIGCGVIVSGSLYRGSRGAAGDISHVRVSGAPDVTCSCGRNGCLEVVASSAAVVRQMREEGADVSHAAEVLDLLDKSDPTAARVLRGAGRATGEVLAGLVSFFNPEVLAIGGVISQAEPFVATLQATLYDWCLPMTMDGLTITTSKAGTSAGILGAGRLLLQHLLSSSSVDAALARGPLGAPPLPPLPRGRSAGAT
ncbi:MAG: ROK family protein [Acidimicrobiales bacterium]